MHQGIHFRMVGFRLGYAIQCGQFGEQFFQRATGMQDLEKNLGSGFHEGPAGFFPNPLGHQVIQFAAITELAHQCQGVVRDAEAEPVITGGESRHT